MHKIRNDCPFVTWIL